MYTTSYNSTRQLNFIQRQTSLFRNRWAVAAAAIFAVLFVITLLTAYFKPYGLKGVLELHNFIFMLMGLIFTSQIFMELHTPNQAYSFLTLPVSTLEKLIGSWLLSSPIYVAAFSLVSFTIYFIGALVAGFTVSPMEFFGDPYWDAVLSYMLLQPIFLWGACYFRKNNFLKTVLASLAVGIATGMYAFIVLWFFYGGTNMNIHIDGSETVVTPFDGYGELIRDGLFLLLALYMLVVSYFTLKERQL